MNVHILFPDSISVNRLVHLLPKTEYLSLHWFRSLRHAHEEIDRWLRYYNTVRPHSALGYQSPTEFLPKTTAAALETLAVSTLPLNTQAQPEASRSNRP
ncbi:transposase [Phaeobacter sp.]|uniref:integrase core domain-containing protein n=1 Tax=Phaeobacter sp. TaxID=1902409 RepID=UPI0025E78433|nr:transposase [Phaeobacter sp.]